jgi:transposase
MAKIPLSDELWQRLELLLPKRRKKRHVQYAGRKPVEDRRVLNGILFVLRTGVPWRALPATSDFPSGVTCWRRLRRWHKAGVWQRLFEALLVELQEAHQIDWYRALVDSASLRAPGGSKKKLKLKWSNAIFRPVRLAGCVVSVGMISFLLDPRSS